MLDTEAGYCQTRAGRAQKRLSSSFFFENTRKYSRSAPLYATCTKFSGHQSPERDDKESRTFFLAGIQLTEHRENDIAKRILHAQRYLSGFQTGFLPSCCLVKPERRACDKFDTDRLLVTALRPWLSHSSVVSTKRVAFGLTR